MVNKCRRCGSQAPGKFCPKCGAPVEPGSGTDVGDKSWNIKNTWYQPGPWWLVSLFAVGGLVVVAATAIVILIVILVGRNGNGTANPTPTPLAVVLPAATATPTPVPTATQPPTMGFGLQATPTPQPHVIRDDFSGPLLWRKEIPTSSDYPWLNLPESIRPPAVSGQVAIESDELSVSADYWWYDVWAVRDVVGVSGDFEASVRFTIMPDDDGVSTKAGLRLGGAAQTVNLVWVGDKKQWVAEALGTQTWVTGPTATKDSWVKVGVRRVNNTYQFMVNDSAIYEEIRKDPFSVTYVALGTSVGVHGEGGTHVHFDDFTLTMLP